MSLKKTTTGKGPLQKKKEEDPSLNWKTIPSIMTATFSGCSRTVGAVSWKFVLPESAYDASVWTKPKSLIAYAGRKSIYLHDFELQKNINILTGGHKDKVNSLEFLPNVRRFPHHPTWSEQMEKTDFRSHALNPSYQLVSAGSDGLVIIWTKKKDRQWEKTQVLDQHKGSVTGVKALACPDHSVILASCSADHSVKVWRLKPDDPAKGFELDQDIRFEPKIMESLCLFLLPESQTPMMATAGTDLLVNLFIQLKGKFVKILSLGGHEDWIRTLSAIQTDNQDVLISSASQDSRIRLWKISSKVENEAKKEDSLQTTAQVMDKTHYFRFNEKTFGVFLESVLSGHEDWVLSADWHPIHLTQDQRGVTQPLALLSASMDRSMMIWNPTFGEVWTNSVHVGEVGGNTLGFFGGVFCPEGNAILANGYNGAFHLWKKESEEKWRSSYAMSGNFGPVVDVSWHRSGQYFAAVSEDQTTRIFCPWVKSDTQKEEDVTWHEISRAQVHGHDLTSIAFIPLNANVFASGAQEKVIRIFAAPQTFLETLQNVTKNKISEKEELRKEFNLLGANVPALGLSNKPVHEDSTAKEDKSRFEFKDPPKPKVHQAPPVEEHLFESTLWPEIHKLYGHPNEIVALAASHSGELIASSCRATKVDQATIRVWSTTTWKEVAQLQAHNLTVVQMEFSHQGDFLLAVSRDRDFSIWSMKDFKLVQLVPKAHERIIWSGSWSLDDKVIATGSRDKTIQLWKEDNEHKWGAFEKINFPQPVTAVSFSPFTSNNRSFLAFGLESGQLGIIPFDISKNQPLLPLTIDPVFWHADLISRIQWRPTPNDDMTKDDRVSLVSVAQDHSIRLIGFNVADFLI